jgi:hypothetical protein
MDDHRCASERDVILYPADEQPSVEVLVDGVWLPGSTKAADQRDGLWYRYVIYQVPNPGGWQSQHVAWFAPDRVKPHDATP